MQTSVSSGSGSASSWNLQGQSDDSTATGSLGPQGQGSSDDNRNTRRRLDTFSSPEDEHARSVVLLRFPCEQYREGVSAWIDSIWATTNAPAPNKPTIIHCKTTPCLPDSYSKQEPNVRTLWPDVRMMVSPTKLIVHFAAPNQLSRFASPIHLKTRKSENNLRLCGKFWPNSSKFSSLKEMTLRSSSVHKFSASRIAGTAWGKSVFKLAPFGNGQVFALTAPDLCVPGIPDEVLQRDISQASQLAQNGAANV